MLPRADLHVEIAPMPGQPEAKRITAALGWQGPNGTPLPAVRLSAWRYRLAEPAGAAPAETGPAPTPTSP
jgi:hypothetical protein